MTKSWDTYRNIIVDLYADRTLAEVRQIMQRDYGFDASTRAYRGRLIRWGVRKYNTRRADGSVSGDEDGEGASSPSDPGSPVSGRRPRNNRDSGHESPPEHRHPHEADQDRGLAPIVTLPEQHSPGYSQYFADDGDSHSPYLSGYPPVSRNATTQPPYNTWSPSDNDTFPTSHSQSTSQVPYSAAFYPAQDSPVFSPYDNDLYHSPPHSTGASSYDPLAYSYGGVGDAPGSEYGHSHEHYQSPLHGNTFGHDQQYTAYPRQQIQYAGGARRGHRERGRG